MKHLLFLFIISISIMASGQIVPPYLQSFDGTTIPANWTQADNSIPASGQIWQFGTSSWDNIPALTGNYAVLNSDAYGEDGIQNADLISPTFDLTGITSVNLQFKHFYYKFQFSTATLSYSINNGADWTVIKTWLNSSSNPEIFNQVIDAVAGQSQVKFKWNYTGAWEWGWAVDDVSVTETPVAIWTGAIDSDWHLTGNWNGSFVPGADCKVTIPATSNDPVIGQDAVCYDLTIVSGAKVTVTPQFSLTVFNELKNDAADGVIVESNGSGTGSLITGSTSGSGTYIIERYMTGNQWHNISSPVVQTVATFLSNNVNIPTNGASRGMTDFNTAMDTWNPYFTNATAGSFVVSKGYLLRNTADGNITYGGTISAGTKVIPLSPLGSGWNLIGNPYTSAICINNDAGINNFLTYNNSSIDINYFGVYVWNGIDYEIINHASGAEYASVGQGFFVKAASTTTADFTHDIQVHQQTVALKSGVLIPEIKLSASTAKKSISTKIKFFKDATTGLDKGYDAGILKADPSFSVFTRLVNDNNIEFGLQCLPLNAVETMTIPVGIDFAAGGDITFSAQLFNISSEKNIVFEDRLLNVFTSFNDTKSVYTANLAASTKGTGRFYLHVSSAKTTGIDNQGLANKINAWMDRSEIVIQGITENKAVAALYDVRGSLILQRNLENTTNNRINVSGINTGIYMLQVVENGKRTGIKLQIAGN